MSPYSVSLYSDNDDGEDSYLEDGYEDFANSALKNEYTIENLDRDDPSSFKIEYNLFAPSLEEAIDLTRKKRKELQESGEIDRLILKRFA